MDSRLESICSLPFRIVASVIATEIGKKKNGIACAPPPPAAISTIIKECVTTIGRIIKMLEKISS